MKSLLMMCPCKAIVWFCCLVTTAFPAFGQKDIPVESWRLHLSYDDIRHVEVTNQRVFAASNSGIIIFDRIESSLRTINKLNGLTGSGINALAYDERSDALLAGYDNGSIDIISPNTVTGFYTLRDADITGPKAINHIAVRNGIAYLSTAYGVVVFDVKAKQIKETWRDLGASGETLAVNGAAFVGDSIFLATANSLMVGSLSKNLLDFTNWKRFDTGAFADGVSDLTSVRNTVYVASSAGVTGYANGAWSEPVLGTVRIESLTASQNDLFIIAGNTIYRLGSDEMISPIQHALISSPAVIKQDENGKLWVGDKNAGLLSNTSGDFTAYRPDGPSHDSAFRLIFHEGEMFLVPGGFDGTGEPLYRPGEVNVFSSGQWATFRQPVDDLTDIAFRNEQILVSSFGGGVTVTDAHGGASSPEELNNVLKKETGDQPKVTALHSTTDGIWIALYDGNHPLYLWSNDGNVESFAFGLPNEEKPIDISVDGSGNIWLALDATGGGGLIAFDIRRNQAFFKTVAIGQGALPNEKVNCLAVDREGYTWIGTNAGVAYFLSPTQDALKPIYENRFLLRDEKITAIGVDGGNRKWIGTERGLWLFNDSGEMLIHHFTSENSPLLSDRIQDIEINSQTGEVFISTDAGLVSYRGDATKGEPGFEAVKVFPNPVRPGYSGVVTIAGLSEDSEVRITDVSGRLLWRDRANGGTASWNLRDQRGNRAKTGVYLIFAISHDGRESVVGKVAIIK